MKTTGFSRVSKNLLIGTVEKEFKSSPIFFITRFGAVSASKLDGLRAKLRGTKSRYFVVKNSLAKRALDKAGLGSFSESLGGPCGIVFSEGDPVSTSKVLAIFAKENETFKIQSGCLNGQPLAAGDVAMLASLPSKEVLLGRVVGGIQ